MNRGQGGSRLAAAAFAGLLALGVWAARSEPLPSAAPGLAVAGLEIGAVDLERSAEFYRNVLGFRPAGGERSPEEVRLVNGGVELILRKAGRPAGLDPEKGARFYLNVEVSDLAATTRDLGARGLSLTAPPRETAIGFFAALRDPAGNVHQVVERKPKSPQPFPPRVFNIGIRMGSMAAAKGFYCRGLGFEVMSEDHPPPIIPLKPKGAAPLILYEGSTVGAEGGEDVARAVLVLDTADLAASLETVRRRGLKVESESPGEGYALLADPSGNRVKLRQCAAAASAP